MSKPKITREKFIEQYTKVSAEMYVHMNERGRFAVPCECEWANCEGWQMTHADDTERYLRWALKGRVPAKVRA
jgi:hypothetical protein